MRNGHTLPDDLVCLPHPISLDLLGGFRLRVGGEDVVPSPTEQRLLGVLAVCGASHRLLVGGILWPEVTDKHAQGSLRTTLWRLHRAVPSLVFAGPHSVALGDEVTVDVPVLERIVDEVLDGHDERVDHLVRLGGDLLPGWYDDWVLAERARLRQLWLQALEQAGRRRLR